MFPMPKRIYGSKINQNRYINRSLHVGGSNNNKRKSKKNNRSARQLIAIHMITQKLEK